MTLAREICNCEHITVFQRSHASPPQILLAANNGPSQIAHEVARKYVAHYKQLNPVRRATNGHDALQRAPSGSSISRSGLRTSKNA